MSKLVVGSYNGNGGADDYTENQRGYSEAYTSRSKAMMTSGGSGSKKMKNGKFAHICNFKWHHA
jgi:hypothetical protein